MARSSVCRERLTGFGEGTASFGGILRGTAAASALQSLISMKNEAMTRDAGCVLGVALLAALCVPAVCAQAVGAEIQTALPPVSGLVLRQTVSRVVVDVVVTDSQGRPVTGLTADDFRVFEDGKQQVIRHFEEYSPGSGELLPARPAGLPPHTFLNLPATPEKQGAPPAVILFDALNTSLSDQMYARQQMMKFLREMPAGVPTAIFVLSDRLHLLQGFSGQREVLLEAAKRQNPIPDQEGLLPTTDANGPESTPASGGESQLSPAHSSAPPGSSGSAGPGEISSQGPGMAAPLSRPMGADTLLTQMADEMNGVLLDQRVNLTLTALDQVARFLSSVPGRKNLIWLSGSFPITMGPDPAAGSMVFANERSYYQQIEDTDNLLCMSQVAVYPVDARGLVAPILRSGPGTAQAYAARLAAEHGSLDQIADDTGGTAYYNVKGLANAILSAIDNGRNYYSLTYAPTNRNFNGKLRHIRLKLDHFGYHLAYRRHYYANPLGEGHDKTEADELADARPGSLMSALQFGAPQAHELIFAARVYTVGAPALASPDQMARLIPFLQNAAQAEGLNFKKPEKPIQMQHYLVQFAVMANELTLLERKDGKYHPELMFATMAYDPQGNALGGAKTTLDAAGIPADKMEQFRREGYQAFQNVYVPLNAASLRVAVRDGQSSRMGSLVIPLPLSTASRLARSRARN